MKRIACLSALLTVSLTAGCVERRFTVKSEPPGALVYHNGLYLGTTPVDAYIVYYGKQQFRLIKEGYETLDVVQVYNPPWYELPGIDFVSENIWPFKVRDVRSFCYTMRPLQSISPEEVRQRAEELRARGQTIGAPRPLPPVPTPPPPQEPTLGRPTPVGPVPPPTVAPPPPGPPTAAPPPGLPAAVNGP